MTASLPFSAISARLALPLLYTAQAQKEVCVNEAFAILDAIVACAIEGTASTPPTAPAEGTCWLVAAGATGAWAGADGQIAACQGGNWILVNPRDGMVALNRATGQFMHYAGGWQAPAAPDMPTGGTTIDTEARACLAAMRTALVTAGVFATG